MTAKNARNNAVIKWQKENMKRIPLDVRKEYYNDVLKPAADRVGESVNGYIKKAVADRIEKERPQGDNIP